MSPLRTAMQNGTLKRYAFYWVAAGSASTTPAAHAPTKGGAMVPERGHVTWLYNPGIPTLFEIPKDFTQQS